MLIPLFSLALAVLTDGPSPASTEPFGSKLRRALGIVRDWSVRQPPSALSVFPALSDADGDGMGDAIGLPTLGVGAGRVVFDLGDGRVLKVAYNRYGQEGNRVEAERWSRLKDRPEVVRFLFPVLEVDADQHLWLVMPRSEEKAESTSYALQDEIADWKYRYGVAIPADIDWFNWGWFEGKWRLLDYGQEEPEDAPY